MRLSAAPRLQDRARSRPVIRTAGLADQQTATVAVMNGPGVERLSPVERFAEKRNSKARLCRAEASSAPTVPPSGVIWQDLGGRLESPWTSSATPKCGQLPFAVLEERTRGAKRSPATHGSCPVDGSGTGVVRTRRGKKRRRRPAAALKPS